jgi:serine/threonine protein kinase
MLKPGMYISDRYEIIDKVGSGGMADVYKAKCHRLNRFVAIKVLKTEYSDDKNFVKKFRGEAQSAAGLSHPNIVNVYDVGDDNGLHYIVMELVEGITLKSFIERKGKLEVKEAIGIAIQIAMGMEAAHTNHIIHRDIKPQNIIISREGKVKVTDFGIAKATTSNTITSNAMGSVHYLSPEQARGGYSDEKSDIYSLGVTLYEMLTGEVPFAGDNTVSVALLHIQGEAIPLREINPTIPLSVEKIVQKCMQKKPERRYLSASELMTDLKRSIANPNGDFVVIPAGVVSDSPTITISDEEVSTINHAAMLNSGIKGNGVRKPINPNNTGNVGNITGTNTSRLNNTSNIGNTNHNLQRDSLNHTDNKRRGLDAEIIEDEELDSVDPRIEKLILVATIAAGVILTIIILFFAIKFFKLFSGDKVPENNNPPVEMTNTPTPTAEPSITYELIDVPSVIGLTLEDAKKTLFAKSESFNVTFKEEYSSEFEKGFVVQQYPLKGAEIAENADIELIISAGPEPIEIPNVLNITEAEAKKKLETAGFVVVVEYAFNDEIEAGRVISSTPERLTPGVKGQTVTIVVSNGPEVVNVVVPDFLNMTQDAALNKLEELGLKRGFITNDYSDKYVAGNVMKQSQPVGASVPKGTAIDLTISLGSSTAVATPTPTVPDEDDESDAQTYIGKITISDNPFEYPGDKGIIKIELEQDGKTRILLKEERSYDSFPIKIDNIISESSSKGTIRMYVGEYVDAGEEGAESENGNLVKYYQYDTSWAINFNKVHN